MKKEELISLLVRYRNNQCTHTEVSRLIEHIRSGKDRDIVESFIDEEFYTVRVDSEENKESLDRVFEQVQRNKVKITTLPIKQSRYLRIASVAAAILIFLTVGIGVYLYINDERQTAPELVSQYGDDVLPGSNRATLQLSDGKTIQLSEDKDGILVQSGAVSYQDGEQLVDTRSIQYATLTTPNGGQYQVTLPDGTRVWLNAASSLKYPTQFANDVRRVELIGEGYFEVAHHAAQPFVVESGGQIITVLGTEFNVSAYANDPVIATTLVEGQVSVSSVHHPAEKKLLKPGEQSRFNHQGITVSSVDTRSFIGWKDGAFLFHHVTLSEILPELVRWYDLEPVTGAIPDARFYAEINRDAPLSEVLSVIESLSDIKFEIKGRRLQVR